MSSERRMPLAIRRPARARGAALLEALVAMLVVAFGVLGFIGLQARTAVTGLEAQQRALALQLVNDMAQRMAINRSGTRAGYYLRADVGTAAACALPTPPVAGSGVAVDLAAFNLANDDVCAWHGLVRAALGVPDAALARVRGCITATGTPGEFQVALVWLGTQPSAASLLECGRGDTASFPDERLRRGAGTLVRIGSLS